MYPSVIFMAMITLGLLSSRHRVNCRLDLNRGNVYDSNSIEDEELVQQSSGKLFPDEPIQLAKPDPSHKTLLVIEENLKKKAGFGVGPSVQPMTMGIWMWGRPAKMKLKSGQDVSVVFIDTEGFAANNVSENYDAKVFAVATMLSSHLLYNSVKIIDQGDIDYLELLARRTQLFALRSQMSRKKWLDDFNEDLLTFPPLTWVVQDFFQDIVDGESPKEWLHRLMTTHTRENEHYEISILDIFNSVDCHTLFIPATKRHLLNDLSKAKESDLTDEYKEERDALINKLTQELTPKKKQGRYLSGVQLAHLINILVTAANDGSLADVPSRWDAFVERLQLTATEDCHKFYEEEVMSFITTSGGGDKPVRSSRLQEIHEQMSSRANDLLDHLLQGLDDALESGRERLDQKIELTFERTRDLNDKKIKLELSEISNSVEIKVETVLNKLTFPIPTTQYMTNVKSLLDVVMVDDVQEPAMKFLEEKDVQQFVNEVKDSLQKVVERWQLRNNEAIMEYFNASVHDAVRKFVEVVHSDWDTKTPQKPALLDMMKENSRKEAENLFLLLTKDYENERPYPSSLSHVKELIREEEVKVDEENSQLAAAFIKTKSSEMLDILKDRTSSFSFPMFDDELERKLSNEVNRIITQFEDAMVDFSMYPTFGSQFELFKSHVSDVCDQRRKENLDAFTQEVHRPLQAAKKIVTLSESKYSTVFSFKQFVRSVCLIHLDDGKPKSWPEELKLQIINNFIRNDDDLRRMINDKEGLWSTIRGFIEWILWSLGMIS